MGQKIENQILEAINNVTRFVVAKLMRKAQLLCVSNPKTEKKIFLWKQGIWRYTLSFTELNV